MQQKHCAKEQGSKGAREDPTNQGKLILATWGTGKHGESWQASGVGKQGQTNMLGKQVGTTWDMQTW
jgi:hypothetical protein